MLGNWFLPYSQSSNIYMCTYNNIYYMYHNVHIHVYTYILYEISTLVCFTSQSVYTEKSIVYLHTRERVDTL